MTATFQLTTADTANRAYEHDCEHCNFQGHDRARAEDIYFCPEHGELVRRWSSEGPDYACVSMEHFSFFQRRPEWAAAFATL